MPARGAGPPGTPPPDPAAPAAGGDLGTAPVAAAAALAVPGVVALTPGRFAEAATYGPGGAVRGVAVRRRPDGVTVEVHLCAAYAPGLDLPALAERVRRAVAAALPAGEAGPGRRIDVVFDDLRFAPRRARRTGGARNRDAAAAPETTSG